MMLRRFPSGMCFARAQGRFPNVGRHCNGCHRWPASYGHSRLRERGWRKRVGAWVSTGRSSRGSESTSPSTCRRPRVAVHVSPSTCRRPRVAVHGSLSTGRCPRVAVHVSLSTGRCPRVAVHVSLSTCRCSRAGVSMLLSICRWLWGAGPIGCRRSVGAGGCRPASSRLRRLELKTQSTKTKRARAGARALLLRA